MIENIKIGKIDEFESMFDLLNEMNWIDTYEELFQKEHPDEIECFYDDDKIVIETIKHYSTKTKRYFIYTCGSCFVSSLMYYEYIEPIKEGNNEKCK